MSRLGITGKLVVGAACIFAGLGVAVTWHSVTQLRSMLYVQIVRRVEAQVLNWIEANTREITVTGDPKTLSRLVRELKERKGIAYVVLTNADGQVMAENGLPRSIFDRGQASAVAETTSRLRAMRDGESRQYFELVTPILASGTGMNRDLGAMFSLAAKTSTYGAVRVGIEQAEIDRDLAGLVRQNSLSYAMLVLLALAVNIVVARRMVSPITTLARVANQIAAGNLSGRVDRGVELRDEVGELVRNFNQMASRLEKNREEMDLLNAGLGEKVRERTLELEQANRRLQELDEVKSKFLSTVSHEFRSPLTSIKAFVQILIDSPTDQETRARFLNIIDKESDRLSRLITDLLDLAKIERKQMSWRREPADLLDIVAQAIVPLASLAEMKQIKIELAESSSQPVWVDTDRMQQVVTNLVGNAIKFSPSGSRIKLRIDRTTTSGPHRALEGAYGLLAVSDSGPGISRDDQERVFEKFFQGGNWTSGSGGTGLGLAISKEIVVYHNGEIWVESEPGFGSTFYVTVPLRSEPVSTGSTEHRTLAEERGSNAEEGSGMR